jgi:hypothetical protein
MANEEHVVQLLKGVDAWNKWRLRNPDILNPNLSGVDLRRADLRWANLSGANLSVANLHGADLRWANLRRADLSGVNFIEANFSGADLSEANLLASNLSEANFSGADLSRASLIAVDFANADLTSCTIFGISAWKLNLEGAQQESLIITDHNEPEITVDNIEVAQFVYLLLHNQKIRDVIDTITSKAVLILGRFSLPERKEVLDKLRDELRKPGRNYVPIVFDFSVPASLDVTETIKVLAGLARFVIADITDATEVRVELHNIVPDFTSLAVQPILLRGQPEFVSFPRLAKFPWMLPMFEYNNLEHLLANLDQSVIGRVEEKVLELRGKTVPQAPKS